MALPDRIPHRITWGGVLIAAGVLLWAWLGSYREYEGCYAMGDDLVFRIGHQGAAVLRDGRVIDQTPIVTATPTRGYVFDLEQTFFPKSLEEEGFFFDAAEATDSSGGARTVVVYLRTGDTNRAKVVLVNGESIEYSRIRCPETVS